MYRTCLIRKKTYNIENSLLKNLVVRRPRSVNSMVEQVKLKIKKSHGLVDNSKFIRKINVDCRYSKPLTSFIKPSKIKII